MSQEAKGFGAGAGAGLAIDALILAMRKGEGVGEILPQLIIVPVFLGLAGALVAAVSRK